MDARHFDALARNLGTRRSTLGGLLAGLLLPLEAVARGKGKGKPTKRKNNGKGKEKGTARDQDRARVQGEPCWRGGACILKKGANVSQCNLAGYTAPPNLNCTGCNLSRANLRGSNLSGVNLTKANLSGACLVNANLTGATIANNTNLANAIFCNTTMPDGWVNVSGCGSGTACCDATEATTTTTTSTTTTTTTAPPCIQDTGACSATDTCCKHRYVCQGGECCGIGDAPCTQNSDCCSCHDGTVERCICNTVGGYCVETDGG